MPELLKKLFLFKQGTQVYSFDVPPNTELYHRWALEYISRSLTENKSLNYNMKFNITL